MDSTDRSGGAYVPTGRDAIDIEIIRNELEAIIDEMKITICRTGRSPLVKVGDFAVTLCDANGHGIGIGHTVMTHPTLYEVARRLREQGGSFASGDVFITNDPFAGASHIPDLVVVCPIVHGDALIGFAATYSHHTDMGGRVAGSQSGSCRETYEEGLQIPLLRLYRNYEREEDILRLILANVRGAEEFVGDLEAKIAGCRRAGEQLCRLVDRQGIDGFERCSQYLNDRSEARMRAAISAIPDGRYSAEVPLHDDGFGAPKPDAEGKPPVIRMSIEVSSDHMIVDFEGSVSQVPGGVNVPFQNTRGMVLGALKDVLAPEVELNEGFYRTVDILAPLGSIVNPLFPAATAGRAPTLFLLEEALFRTLAQALPGKVPVPRDWWDVVFYSGKREDGTDFAIMDLFSGGWGARPDKDGPDGISASPSTSLPIELLERDYPMMIESFGLVADSGGPGQYRGSQAVERRYRFLSTGKAMIRTNRTTPTKGLNGGGTGHSSSNHFRTAQGESELALQAFHHLDVQAGDILIHRAGGCGGFGPPEQRDPAAVARDLREGRISPETAASVYKFDRTGIEPGGDRSADGEN